MDKNRQISWPEIVLLEHLKKTKLKAAIAQGAISCILSKTAKLKAITKIRHVKKMIRPVMTYECTSLGNAAKSHKIPEQKCRTKH